METKTELVNSIKEWMKIDSEISALQNEIKERRNKKKMLSINLLDVMKTNDIDCFDIKGGALMYKRNNVKKPISGKSLMECLNNYYGETPEKASELTKYILDNRIVQVKESIRWKIDK
jgi:hypothetical protein